MAKVNLNIRVEQSEMEILESYAQQTGRTKTDIIREYIRSLAIRRPPHSFNEWQSLKEWGGTPTAPKNSSHRSLRSRSERLLFVQANIKSRRYKCLDVTYNYLPICGKCLYFSDKYLNRTYKYRSCRYKCLDVSYNYLIFILGFLERFNPPLASCMLIKVTDLAAYQFQ